MTNPDLTALANELDDIETDAAGKCNWSEVATVSDALRRLASSDGVVKVRELEWQQSHVSPWQDDWHSTGPFTYTIRCADENRWKWSSGYGYGWCSTPDAAKAAAQADYEARIRSALVEVPAVKGEPELVAWPANLNPRTLDLVQRFALALAKKLRLAEEKYDHTDGWLRDDWESECRDHLYQHLEKGDPRDVAAYCAFMWHHDWITCRPVITAPPADAGMREALGKVCIYRVEGDDTIHLLINGEKIGAFGQHTSKAIALLRFEASLREACMEAALTAPGATTKSDDAPERFADSAYQIAEEMRKEDRPPDPSPTYTIAHDGFTGTVQGHYVTREGKQGVVLQQVGTRVVHVYGRKWIDGDTTSDPSLTRSEVTVESLADWLNKRGSLIAKAALSNPGRHSTIDLARAMLDQFQIRSRQP